MTVAVGRHIDHQIDVEAGPPVHYGFGVFRDLAVQHIIGLVRGGKYRVFGTDADTSAAAHAFVMVDGGFAVCKFRRSVGADLLTAVAADTEKIGRASCREGG